MYIGGTSLKYSSAAEKKSSEPIRFFLEKLTPLSANFSEEHTQAIMDDFSAKKKRKRTDELSVRPKSDSSTSSKKSKKVVIEQETAGNAGSGPHVIKVSSVVQSHISPPVIGLYSLILLRKSSRKANNASSINAWYRPA